MQYLKQSTEIKVRIGPAMAYDDGVTAVTDLTLGGADQAEPAQPLPQQGQRMAPQAQAEAGVVGDDRLALAGRRQQGQGRLVLRQRRQRQGLAAAGHLPAGLVAVAGESGQGIGGSQGLQVPLPEAGALG